MTVNNQRTYLCLDVGGQRIGLAWGDSIGRIAQPLKTVSADDEGIGEINRIVQDMRVTDLVVGLPRDQRGEETSQTTTVKQFTATNLAPLRLPIHWQDESVTSIMAEQRLTESGKRFHKADIDAEAAAIILQDYLEGV
ncbi:MAG: Holliday junction resolvase RuvX [Candidatus Saccharimonadales bacterium]